MSAIRPPESSVATVDPTRRNATHLYGQPHQLEALATDFERYLRFGRRVGCSGLVWLALVVGVGTTFAGEWGLLMMFASVFLAPLAMGAAALKFLFNRRRLRSLHPLPTEEHKRRLKDYKRWRSGRGHPHVVLFNPPELAGAAYARDMLGDAATPKDPTD